MGRAAPVCYESRSLVDARAQMLIAGPAGYTERASLDDYDDLGEIAKEVL